MKQKQKLSVLIKPKGTIAFELWHSGKALFFHIASFCGCEKSYMRRVTNTTKKYKKKKKKQTRKYENFPFYQYSNLKTIFL